MDAISSSDEFLSFAIFSMAARNFLASITGESSEIRALTVRFDTSSPSEPKPPIPIDHDAPVMTFTSIRRAFRSSKGNQSTHELPLDYRPIKSIQRYNIYSRSLWTKREPSALDVRIAFSARFVSSGNTFSDTRQSSSARLSIFSHPIVPTSRR